MSSTSAPNRRSFFGRGAAIAAVNARGYYVGRVEKNLYWVTDATYQVAFLTTRDGVVLFDAPRPSDTTFSAPSTRSPQPTTCPGR